MSGFKAHKRSCNSVIFIHVQTINKALSIENVIGYRFPAILSPLTGSPEVNLPSQPCQQSQSAGALCVLDQPFY